MISDYRMSYPMLGVAKHAKVRLGFTSIDPESNFALSRKATYWLDFGQGELTQIRHLY